MNHIRLYHQQRMCGCSFSYSWSSIKISNSINNLHCELGAILSNTMRGTTPLSCPLSRGSMLYIHLLTTGPRPWDWFQHSWPASCSHTIFLAKHLLTFLSFSGFSFSSDNYIITSSKKKEPRQVLQAQTFSVYFCTRQTWFCIAHTVCNCFPVYFTILRYNAIDITVFSEFKTKVTNQVMH